MPKFAANLSFLFREAPFIDRFQLAASCGFEAVEFLFPYILERRELAHAVANAGVEVVMFDFPPGDNARGEYGIACHPDRIREFRDGIPQAIDYAKALNCRQLNCLTGIAPSISDSAILRRTLIDNLRIAADLLAESNIDLLVEPINTTDIPGYFLHHSNQALDIIDEVDRKNVFLQYDMYHAHIMGEHLLQVLKMHGDRIAHIQIADFPGRHEPGTGIIEYPRLFQLLDEIGYTGWVGCEYRPQSQTKDGLVWIKSLSLP
jgi:hydroxypyruvate isomerase